MNELGNIVPFERELVECPSCGGVDVSVSHNNHSFQYGSGKSEVLLEVVIPVGYCEVCDLEFSDHVADRIRHEAVCTHLGVMTPRAITDLREGHCMSKVEFARVTGLGEASISRWERGSHIQNIGIDNYLRLLMLAENIGALKTKLSEEPLEPSLGVVFQLIHVTPELRLKQAAFQL